MTFRGKSGTGYIIIKPAIGKGGAGSVYKINGILDCVLKIFVDNKRTETKHRKLLAMISSFIPDDAMHYEI